MTKEEEEESGNDVQIKEMESLMAPNEEITITALCEDASPSSVGQSPPSPASIVSAVTAEPTKNQDIGVQTNLPVETEQINVDIISSNWQSVLILKFQRRLAEQEVIYRRLLREKDDQLFKITNNLCLLESKLRREQETIERILDEKDKKIIELDQHLQQLLRLNRRLAAGHRYNPTANTVSHSHSIIKRNGVNKQRQRRRITWHNEVHIIHEYEPKTDAEEETKEIIDSDQTPQTFNEISELNESEQEAEPDGDCLEMSEAINEACQAVDEALQEAETDEEDDNHINNNNSSWTDLVVSHRTNNSASLPLSISPGDDVDALGATVVYNRIMNNHRTVTKPKDVKYKKISRVKSRSLEELRGKLKKPPVNTLYSAHSLTHRVSKMVDQEEIL